MFKRQPYKFNAQQIMTWECTYKDKSDGSYKPARPIAHNVWNWTYRWKAAYDVLIGRADALYWD